MKVLKTQSVGNYKLKYNFESNSQRGVNAIKNQLVGNYKLKYNFESNSQHEAAMDSFNHCWEL